MSIRVAVVDDQALVRGGFAMVLRIHDDIEVVAEAGTGIEAIEVAHRHRPDVILMDIRMPDMDGLEATSRILAEADWNVRVLILTTFDPDEYVYKALRAGASGFVLKDIPPRNSPPRCARLPTGERCWRRRSPGASSASSRSASPSTPRCRAAWNVSPTGNRRYWLRSRGGPATRRSPRSSSSDRRP